MAGVPPTTFVDQQLGAYLAAIQNNQPLAHLLTLPKLDSCLGGIHGRMIAIAGEPGTGKTSFAGQLADDLASQGVPVLFFTMEMPSKHLVAKSLARLSKTLAAAENKDVALTINQLATPENFPFDYELHYQQVIDTYGAFTAPNIAYIDDITDPIDISTRVTEVGMTRERTPVVVIDYLQIMSEGEDAEFNEERLQIKYLLQSLHRMIRKTKAPVFMLSSINRTSYSKASAGLESLGGSSYIEYSTDAILFLSVEGKGEKRSENLAKAQRPYKLTLLKNRYGPTAEIDLLFDVNHARFIESAAVENNTGF